MYPKLTKEVLENLLRTACELGGKNYNERLLDLYWEFLRDLPMKDVRKAFLAFNACATFPSAAKVMLYCGYTPPSTEPRETETPPIVEEKPDTTYLEKYGNWTFESRYLGESKVGAEQEFSRCRNLLLKEGWNIEEEIPYECIAETQMGKHVKKQKLWKLHFWASRPDPNAPTPPPRDVRTVAELEKLQVRLAHRASAADLANKVMRDKLQQNGAKQ